MADTTPPDAAFLEGLEIVARYVRHNGSRALAPSGRLESEVDRLAARTPGCSVIVARPDRQLVARLQDDVGGGVRLVQQPPAHHLQALPGLGGAGGLHSGCSAARWCRCRQ
ncbi:hypothetical protein AB0D40_31860 [Streptomyces massasporeus]|uniref:hypothetical protein n=1 Tax=Streptomyces massasporeus TaxID=67324 RepID=UPI0034033D10